MFELPTDLLVGSIAASTMAGVLVNDRLIYKLSGRLSQGRVRKFLSKMNGSTAESLRHRFNKAYFNRHMRGQLGHFMNEVDEGPFPPKELIMGTFVLDEADAPKKLNPDFYFSSGYGQLLWWLRSIEEYGFNIRTASAIMELGSGSGRLIRHFRCIDGIRLVGTDLNTANVKWCQENLQGIEFHQNALQPPLTFAEDNTFDLVYAASVFTHIPFDTQRLWIKEMHRILKPGGFLVCDVLGRYHQERMLDKEDMKGIRSGGELTITQTDPKASLSTKVIGSWDVFMSRQEVIKRFGAHFTICDYTPGIIDTLFLRKDQA